MVKSVKEWMDGAREFPRTLPDDPEVAYLSPSQIRTLFTCGKMYDFKYLQGRPQHMGVAAWFGIACHDGLCEGFTDWIDTGIRPDASLVMDAAEDKLRQFLTELGPDKLTEHGDLTDEDIEQECREVRTISKLLYEWTIENEWRPLASEVEVSQRYKTFATYGFADLVAVDKHDRLWVLDYKTTSRTPNHGQANRIHAFQLIVYASAIEEKGIPNVELPGPIHGTAAVYAVRNKTPKVVFAPVPFHEGTKAFASSMAHNAGDQIQFGELSPNPVSASWKCHPDRCSYWSDCPGSPKHEHEETDIDDGIPRETS